MNRVHLIGLCVVLAIGSEASMPAAGQEPGPAVRAGVQAIPIPEANRLSPFANQRVKPLMEGPLHEAFLSPRKDRNPFRIEKAPPPPHVGTARHRSTQRHRRVDRGLLGVGCRPQGLRLGHGNVAGSSPGSLLGQRLLEERRPGLVPRAGLLERAEDGSARLPQEWSAAGTSRR